MKTKIFTFCNAKGGTGKTTTVSSLGSALVDSGKKVLLVDLDQQTNLTQLYTPETFTENIFTALTGEELPHPFTIRKNYDLIVGSEEMAYLELNIFNEKGREDKLKNYLDQFVGKYDYIFIDTAPNLNLTVINALTASDFYVVPIPCEMLAVAGLAKLTNFAQQIKENFNPKLELGGVLITRYERNNLGSNIETLLRAQFPKKVFKTKIRKAVVTAETPAYHTDVVQHAPKSTTAQDYITASKELAKI